MATVTMATMKPKAILFDLDGTLLDTEALSDKAIVMALADCLPPPVLEEAPMSNGRLPWELKKQILGLRGAEWAPLVLSYATKYWGVATEDLPSADEIWKGWEENLNTMCEEVESCEGAAELVEALSKTGLPMAIATSSRGAGVAKKRVRHDRIFLHMKTIVVGDDPAIKHGKPAPDMYLEAARRLGMDPADCLVFEDALSGVRAGKSAGCNVVAIPDSRFTEEEKSSFRKEADLVIDSLQQFSGDQFGFEALH